MAVGAIDRATIRYPSSVKSIVSMRKPGNAGAIEETMRFYLLIVCVKFGGKEVVYQCFVGLLLTGLEERPTIFIKSTREPKCPFFNGRNVHYPSFLVF
jgi:hypothetical protein